jgi:CIC family chloride channel protein
VLGNFAMNLFAPLVFAAVVATMLSRSFFGIEPWYEAPEFNFTNMLQLPWFVLLGLVAGGAGAYFLKTLRQFEAWFSRVPAQYLWARLALGGLLLGLLAVPVPEAWGNGRQPTNLILHEPMVWHALLVLLLAKWLAIGTSVGSGAMGGLITPTLFIGAGVGGLIGALLHEAHWALSLPTGAFALVGMASVFAATTHSPLLAMILAFELSLNYSFMPPLMIGCVVATLVSRHLHPHSVYNEAIRRRGLTTLDDRTTTGAADQQTIGDLMLEPVPPVRENTPLREVANRFLTSNYNFIPVVDAQKRLLGVVALHDLKEHLNAGDEFSFVIAYDLMRPMPRPLVPSLILTEALPILLKAEMEHVPVVDNLAERRLIGRVPRTDALGLLSETIATAGQNPNG